MQVLIVPAESRTIEPVVTQWDGERLAFAKRFNLACDRAGIPAKGRGRQTAVATLFQVSQKGARKWLEGEAIPNTKRLPAMARLLGVTTEWLLTGDDPPLTGGLPVGEEAQTYDLEDLRVARAIRSLPPKSRVALQTVLDAFAKSAPWGGVERRRGGKGGKG
jgi:transcriptional regulator with XRE-family HTH domain